MLAVFFRTRNPKLEPVNDAPVSGSESGVELGRGASGFCARLRRRDIAVNEAPVLFEGQLRESLGVTRAIVLEVGARARARGGALAFLVVSFGARSDEEERLVQAVFAGT